MTKYTVFKKAACFLCTALWAAISAHAQSVVKVQNGTGIITTGGAAITLKDMDLNNDGTISQQAATGSFVFTGIGNNTISGTAIPLFDILQIAKTGSAKISLQQDIQIGSGISFGSGLIDLNAQHILLQPTALLNGESETSRIFGTGGGYVEITSLLNGPSSVNPGNLGSVITSSQNLGSTVIRRGHVSQANGSGTGSTILRYYDIIPANNTALNATLRLQYFDAELNSLDENDLVLWKSTDNVHWTKQGFSTRDASGNYAAQTGIADFSRWTLSTAANALPLRFTLFTVRCEGSQAAMGWKTAQEQNTAQFAIERSADGIHWTAIAYQPAAGNSTGERSYSYTDKNAPAGESFYRIAAHDFDNHTTFTAVNHTDCGNTGSWKAWPNPVQETLWITITTAAPSAATIKLFDSKGVLLKTQAVVLPAGSNQFSISMANLPAGVYHIAAEWNKGSERKKISVVKSE